MNNSSSAQVWAVLTVILGLGIAVPFLKQPSTETRSQSSAGESHASPHFRSQRAVTGKLPAVPEQSELQDEAALAAYVRAQLQERPTLVQMPEWATPESGLDVLIQTGPQSAAPNHAPTRLGELPTLVSNPAERRHQEAATEAIAGEDTNLAQVVNSPWSNQHKVPNYISTGGPDPAPAWADDVFAARARMWHDQPQLPPNVAEFMRYPDVGRLASGSIAEMRSNGEPSRQQPAEDRRRRFVYQPGIQMPED